MCIKGVKGHIGWPNVKGGECGVCAQKHLKRFKTLDEAHKVRRFSLRLHLEVPRSVAECTMRTLEWNVKVHKDGELGYLLSKPIISTRPHIYNSLYQ